MNIVICDICRKNEAVESFKVKRCVSHTHIEEYGNKIPSKRWERIDICHICYYNIIKTSRGDDI